jgi:hypothetical protein
MLACEVFERRYFLQLLFFFLGIDAVINGGFQLVAAVSGLDQGHRTKLTDFNAALAFVDGVAQIEELPALFIHQQF